MKTAMMNRLCGLMFVALLGLSACQSGIETTIQGVVDIADAQQEFTTTNGRAGTVPELREFLAEKAETTVSVADQSDQPTDRAVLEKLLNELSSSDLEKLSAALRGDLM